MRILTPDLRDDAVLAAMLANRDAAVAATRHRPVSLTFEEWARELRFVDSAERVEYAVAADDSGQIVGHAVAWLPLQDNLDKCFGELLVHPDHWRRGAGRALAQWLDRTAMAANRTQVLTHGAVPADAGEEHGLYTFARAVGHRVANLEIERHAALPVPSEVLDTLWGDANAWSRDYDIEVHADGVPPQLVSSVCAVMNQLGVDAPTGEVDFEAETWDETRYGEFLAHERSVGRRRLTALAIHRQTGQVVAYSDIALPAGDPKAAQQWGTLVSRDHRGHQLGTAIKVANLRALIRDFPEREVIGTCNAETNRWMVAINEALGFAIVEKSVEFVRTV